MIPSTDIKRTSQPADLANFAPAPGNISTQCTLVPRGIKFKGRAFPGVKSTFSCELKRTSPTLTDDGAKI